MAAVLVVFCLLASCSVNEEPNDLTASNNLTDFALLSNQHIDSSINTENYPQIGVTDFTILLSQNLFTYKFYCDDSHLITAHRLYPRETHDEASLIEALKNNEIDVAFIEKTADDTVFQDTLEYTQIGVNAIVFFTSDSNTVNGIAAGDINEVYKSHAVKDWQTLGGKAGNIMIPEKDDSDLAMTAFKKILDVRSDKIFFNLSAQQAASLLPDPNLKGAYAAYAKAPDFVIDYELFSFFEFGSTTDSAFSTGVKKLEIDKQTISNDAILSGEYPYVVKIYAVTNKISSDSSVQHMISWLQNSTDNYEVKFPAGIELLKGF